MDSTVDDRPRAVFFVVLTVFLAVILVFSRPSKKMSGMTDKSIEQLYE